MTAQHELEQVVREEWGRLIAVLLARLSRLDLVKDALADAIEAAARTWAHAGVPNNPAGWLHRTAQRRVLDRLRAEAMASRKHVLIATDLDRAPTAAMADPGGLVEDDVLRLVLMCTHPALAPEAASALALRLVLGVSTQTWRDSSWFPRRPWPPVSPAPSRRSSPPGSRSPCPMPLPCRNDSRASR